MAKIALFLSSLDGGGAERVNINLAKGFAALGHDVDLVCVNAKGEYQSHIPDNVSLLDFNTTSNKTAMMRFKEYLNQDKPDVVFLTMVPANVAGLLARMMAKHKPPMFGRTDNSTKYMLMQLSFIRKLRVKWLFPLVDGQICVSKGAAEDYKSHFRTRPSKVYTIYNPFDIDAIIEQSKLPCEHPWIKSKKIPTMVAAGRFVDAKNYPSMLRSLAIANKTRDVQLIILGQGPLESKLHALAKELEIDEKVDFVGFQENPYAYFANADGFLFTSRNEGFGNVLVEALACGASISSVDCQHGPAEILEGDAYGALVPVNDDEAIAKAMLRMIDHPSDPERQRKRAYDFSIEKIAQEYLDLVGI